MTPTLQKIHAAHKARQMRFKQAARSIPQESENPQVDPDWISVGDAIERAVSKSRKKAEKQREDKRIEEERRQRKLQEMRRLGIARHQQIILETAVKYKAYGVSLDTLKQSSRTKMPVLARHEAFWRLFNEQRMTLTQIGRLFGRHHTTVLHGVRRYQNLFDLASGEHYHRLPKNLPSHLILRNQNMESAHG